MLSTPKISHLSHKRQQQPPEEEEELNGQQRGGVHNSYGSLLEEAHYCRDDDDKDNDTNLMNRNRSYSWHSQRSTASQSSLESVTSFIVDHTFILEGPRCSVRDRAGQATIVSTVAGMTKNLIGSGVLSLSGGIALFSNNPATAIYPASLFIVVGGAIFGYFCLLIARVCEITQSATFRECWEETMGDRGAEVVSIVYALLPAIGTLSYSTVLSQSLELLLPYFLPGIQLSRVTCLWLVTVLGILPLCLLKNIYRLAPFSVLGSCAIVLANVAMIVRCLDGSYQPGGLYYDSIPPERRPSFGSTTSTTGTTTAYYSWSEVLPFVCMVFESYVMHYNVPRYYTELKTPTIPRFRCAVGCSFALSAALYISVAVTGFLTFGGHADGYILNNYSFHDPLATLSRLAIALSTLTIYPIAFIGFRDGVLDILNVPIHLQTSANLNVLTIVLLLMLTVTAMFVTDLGLINAVGGGTLATVLVFVFPALMYRRAAVMMTGISREYHYSSLEVWFIMALVIVGLAVGTIGVWEAIVDYQSSLATGGAVSGKVESVHQEEAL